MRDALSRVFAAAMLAGALALSASPAGAAQISKEKETESALVDKTENVGSALGCGPTHLARVHTRTFDA